MSVLGLTGVRALLGGRAVLDGVDLEIGPGERVALCGPNGAGKSSLIRVAAGLLAPSEGRTTLGGADVKTLASRERAARMAYLPQDGRIAWNMAAVEVAALGLPFLAVDRAQERARAALEEVGAGHLADRGVADLSGGERARVLLARMLATDAPLLLADEPVTGLDPDAQLLVLDRLAARAAAGTTVVASLHDLGFAARWAGRAVVIDRGRIVADGPPAEALAPEVLRAVFGLAARWIDGPSGPLLDLTRAA